VEAFTPKVAGRFVTEMVQAGQDRATLNRRITAASSYWKWMTKRAGVEVNPWMGQSLAKLPKAREDDKRPFTDAEMVKLLEGETDAEMADAIRVLALSGMRMDEPYRLRVWDCADGWFSIRDAKTRAGVRRVPIHPDIAEIISRRTERQPSDAFLFPEAGPARAGNGRSAAISKRFGRYRKSVGVHDAREGRRHSLVDGHSLRRWFVTKAREGFDRATVAALVGHEVGNLTDDTYSGGPTDARKVECVASVKLPPHTATAAKIRLKSRGRRTAVTAQSLQKTRRSALEVA
jgi:integrase